MTLEDIKKIPKEMLIPTDISEFIGVNPYSITLQAREDPSKLGFPTIVMGTRTYIPKTGFIFFCEYGQVSSNMVEFMENAMIDTQKRI